MFQVSGDLSLSNVLIGIIGVILFIGLALAGALILGDDFKSASSSTIAATLMSQMKQAADAADMRKLKLGKAYTPSMGTSFLVPRFLKTEAQSPVPLARANPGDYRWAIQFNNNIYADGVPEGERAALYIQAVVGPRSDAKARDVCLNIAQTYGAADIEDTTGQGNFPHPVQSAGCVLANAYQPTFSEPQQYIAFIRVAPTTANTAQPVD